MPLNIPELSLVLLIGPSGAGKSSFARKHFKPTEVLSSDYFRGLVADDETDQGVSAEAFATLHFVASQRMKLRKLTVIDATNVQPEARKPLVALAKEYHYLLVAIVFNLAPELCHARNQQRADRQFGPHVVRGHAQLLKRSLPQLEREGFRIIFTLSSPEEVEAAVVERQPLWTDKRDEHGPFDFIGDIHGCYDELLALLGQLGYAPDPGNEFLYRHPEGRRLVFVGDLVDRGPKIVPVLRLVMTTLEAG
jgi:protein phosphatase